MNDRQFRFYYKKQEEIQTTVAMPCSNWFDFFSLLTSKTSSIYYGITPISLIENNLRLPTSLTVETVN
jgi:hypothetical protein